MALVEVGSGSQACTLDTPHTLDTETGGKTYVFGVNLQPMLVGDVVILRAWTKLLSGSTSRLAYRAIYANVQEEHNVYSPPIPANREIIVTIEQTDGTGRTYEWALLSID